MLKVKQHPISPHTAENIQSYTLNVDIFQIELIPRQMQNCFFPPHRNLNNIQIDEKNNLNCENTWNSIPLKWER